jgi:hypothetical protein
MRIVDAFEGELGESFAAFPFFSTAESQVVVNVLTVPQALGLHLIRSLLKSCTKRLS